jgi:hypothetical protein
MLISIGKFTRSIIVGGTVDGRVSEAGRTRVRYELPGDAEGFVMSRSHRAAAQALHRMLERHKALGNRVRRRVRADGSPEYLVTSPQSGRVARYWIDPGRLDPAHPPVPRHMLMPKKS